MAKQVSTTYGNALFEMCLEEGCMDDIFKEVAVVREAFSSNQELLKLLNHPKINKDEKIKLIENIFKGNISDNLTGFLILIVKKDRQDDIFDVLDFFKSKVYEYKNIGIAYITSAIELTEVQKRNIVSKLIATTRYEKIETVYYVDKSIIGGLIIRILDQVVDSSIKTQIDNLSKQMAKSQIS